MDFYAITTQESLERIARHCPQSLIAYLHCINRADSNGKFYFSKEFVKNNMSESWTKFVNQIKKLAVENVLEWHPFLDGISVTLADQHENG